MTDTLLIFDDHPIITLSAEDVRYCQLVAMMREKYGEWKENPYRQGVLNSDKDTFKTERTGVHGERAISKIFGDIPLDESYHAQGDDGTDFVFARNNHEIIVDGKFHGRPANWKGRGLYGGFYIKATTKYGKRKTKNDYKADVFIFTVFHEMMTANGELVTDSRVYKEPLKDINAQYIKIKIMGSITKDEIFRNWEERLAPTIYKSKYEPDAKNYYIKEEELTPVSTMLCKYEPYIWDIPSTDFSVEALQNRNAQ